MKTTLVTIALFLVAIGLTTVGSAQTIAGIDFPDTTQTHSSISDSGSTPYSISDAYATADVIANHGGEFTYTGAEAEDGYAYAYSASMGGDDMDLTAGASITSTGDVVALGQAYADGETSTAGIISTAEHGEDYNTASIDASASATGEDVIGYAWAVAFG